MKSYKSITSRYLKGQKNRTFLTIFGIILSVSLITAIGTMVVSARNVLIQNTIESEGSFHAKFMNIDESQMKILENHVEVKEIGKTKFIGSLALRETSEEERDNARQNMPFRTIDLREYNKEVKELLPINLKEGRLPEKSNEIAIEKWTREFFSEDLKIGDTIRLPVGNRIVKENTDPDASPDEEFERTGEREYKVVGFTSPKYIWRGNLSTNGIVGIDKNSSIEGKQDAYIILQNVKGANEKVGKIAKDIGVQEKDISYNNDLLRLSAESINDTFNSSILGILIFVVALIMLSTIAVIYNAFNISVIERISQFGLLRSIGATPKQIRNLVYREAAIVTAIGIPIGLVLGVFAMKVVLFVISLIQDDIDLFMNMEANVSLIVFLISTVLGVITVFLSARGPAKRAGSVSPLEAIKNTEELKKEDFKKAKYTGFIRKLFGIEGEIAYKNLKRNKKRFIITVFSMVLSIVLFITFSSFSNFLYQSGIIDESDMADFQVFGNIGDKQVEVYDKINSSDAVNRIYTVNKASGSTHLDKDKISQGLIDMDPNSYVEKKGRVDVMDSKMISIGDENLGMLKGLLKQGDIDIETMNKENGVLVINNTYVMNENGSDIPLVKGFKLKVGDTIPFSSDSQDVDMEELKSKDLKVVGVLEKGILGEEYNKNGGINIISTEEVFNRVNEIGSDRYINMYIEMKEDGNKENISNLLKELEDDITGLRFMDYAETAQKARNTTIIVSIFLYGFVTIITLISAINIINTISTNIILRTKEIAMIKAVGMTNKGIKKMVAFESIFYGLYASVFGTIIGVGLSFILYRLIGGIVEFPYVFPFKSVIIAAVGALVIAILSGTYPLKRINNKIIVESMKETN